jgi:hypothetical protein
MHGHSPMTAHPGGSILEQKRSDTALDLMHRFAERTGVGRRRSARRYLWTDAFAVCNLIGFGRATGHHRHDDARSGWLSGLSDNEGVLHPTAGGLRVSTT